MKIIETDRLILRNWLTKDIAVLTEINQDPVVMKYYPSVISLADTRAFIEKAKTHIATYGFGAYACELKTTGKLIGIVGSGFTDDTYPFKKAVAMVWRLAQAEWGKGYAVEAAKAIIKEGFEIFHHTEMIAFTVPHNFPSRHVMEKLKMTYNPKDDFCHPKLPLSHPLSLHVLYRIKKEER